MTHKKNQWKTKNNGDEWIKLFNSRIHRKQLIFMTLLTLVGALLIIPDGLFIENYPIKLSLLRSGNSLISMVLILFYWRKKIGNTPMVMQTILRMFLLLTYIISTQTETHRLVQQQDTMVIIGVIYMSVFLMPGLYWWIISFLTLGGYIILLNTAGNFPFPYYLSNGGIFLIGGLIGFPLIGGYRYRLSKENSLLRWQLQEQHDELEFYANKDSLTGAVNRRGGLLLLEEQIKYSQRQRSPLTICFIDINGLKRVNDTLGHPTGDELICTFVKVFEGSIRTADIFFRYAGDEFICVFPQCSKEEAQNIIIKIHGEKDRLNASKNYPFHLDFSSGIVTYDLEANPGMGDYIKEADQLMYLNKMQVRDVHKSGI